MVPGLVIAIWCLVIVCDLVLGIWDLPHLGERCVLGTTAEFWMHAQSSYDLATHRIDVRVKPLAGLAAQPPKGVTE